MLNYKGGTFFKPLFFEFPDDSLAYANQTTNIMIGTDLKLSIQTEKLNQNETFYVFPKGVWCDIYGTKGPDSCLKMESTVSISMPSKAGDFHLHLREGGAVPMFNGSRLVNEFRVTNTRDLTKYGTEFHFLPKCSGVDCRASTFFLNDDGVVTDPKGGKRRLNNYSVNFNFQNVMPSNITTFSVQFKLTGNTGDKFINNNDYLSAIHVYNAAAMYMFWNYNPYDVLITWNNQTTHLMD